MPTGEDPAARCAHCGRPFASQRLHDLHLGERHPDACTEPELAAHEDARAAESDDLFVYHIKVIAALSLLYAGFVIAYMVVIQARA